MAGRSGGWVMAAAALVAALLAVGPVAAEGGQQTAAQPTVIRLTTLEWPPYAGRQLPGQGVATAVARAALGQSGAGLEVDFFPWQRAVAMGMRADGYVGYYPEYYSPALEDRCLFSRAAGVSALGFVERRADPVAWASLDDLHGKVIGVVQGYVNTDAFDRHVAEGRLRVDTSIDDRTNLRKVASGRIDMAVIDRSALTHLLAADPALADIGHTLQFNARILETKQIHVCFRPTPEGRAARALFDQGIVRIDAASVMRGAMPSPAPPLTADW